MHKITLYADGACSGNPGVGGWAALLMCGNHKKEISGSDPDTTNNRMELLSVIEGLKIVKQPSEVSIYSDSAYVVNAFTQKWIDNWVRNGWRTANKTPVLNKELWLKLLELVKVHTVNFVKVKGHSDNEFNNRCDELAQSAIKKYKEKK